MNLSKTFELPALIGKAITQVSLLVIAGAAMLQSAHAGIIAAVDFGTSYNDYTLALKGNTGADATAASNAGLFIYNLAFNGGTPYANGTTHNGFLLNTGLANSVLTGAPGNDSISLANKGNYVFTLQGIDLETSNSVLTINAPAGSNVVLVISGAFVVNNGSIVLSGGITSNNVVYRLSNTIGATVSNGKVTGNILGTGRAISVTGNSKITGRVIASTVSIGNGSVVSPEF